MVDLIVTIFILWPLITILYYWNVAVKLRIAERKAELVKKTNPWTEPVKATSVKHGTPKPRAVVFVDKEVEEILEDAKPAGNHVYDPKQHKVVWVPAE